MNSVLNDIARSLREGMIGREFKLAMNIPRARIAEVLELTIEGSIKPNGASAARLVCDASPLLEVHTMPTGEVYVIAEPMKGATKGKRNLIDQLRKRLKGDRHGL